MTTKMKLLGAIAAVATVFGLGATTVALSDTIDQKLTDIEQSAESVDGSDVTSWRAVWRWGYRPTVRYYSGYRYAGYRYGAYRYAGYRHYGPTYRRAWTPGRWSWGGYRRGYYRYW
jgi:hypothetical protein